MRGVLILTAILFAFLAVEFALAKPRQVLAGAEAERWAAVGILQVNGGGWCSAALLDQKTVLTAAHCLYVDGRRKVANPQDVQFNAGWRDGITAAVRNAVRITAHRSFSPRQPHNAKNVAADLAVVELDLPIEAEAARAFGTIDRIRPGMDVSIVSFSGLRSDVASINEDCSVSEQKGDILILTCASFGGMSGAPVFTFVNGKPRIAALISGSKLDPATGENRAIALAINAPLGRITIDATATRSMPMEGLPSWASRSARSSDAPVTPAVRKTVSVPRGGDASPSQLTGSGSSRSVVRPPTE